MSRRRHTMTLPQMEAYRNLTDRKAYDAARSVSNSIREYTRINPGASVSDIRDYTIEILSQVFYLYGNTGAAVAAVFYDDAAAALGLDLDPAEIFNDVNADQIERIARYQAGKLVEGDFEGYVFAVSSSASDHVLRAVNSTVVRNTGRPRDKRSGARFARIPSGRETCTFCTMLASRGFVYHTRENAKLNGHQHRNCDCRVVMGSIDTEVEGYDTDALYDKWREFERIDKMKRDDGSPLSRVEKDTLKRSYADK